MIERQRQQARRWTSALVVGLGLALAGAAAAQPAPPPAGDAAALEASGQKHFDLAEYDAAVRDFKEAYRLTDQPGFLFNIAQAYRLGGDCRQALTFYKTFVRRVPDAPNLAKVKGRITEMEACVAKLPPATGSGTDPATGGGATGGGEPGGGTTGGGEPGGGGGGPTTGGGDPAGGGDPTGAGAGGAGGPAGPAQPVDGGGAGGGWKKWAGVGGLAAGGLAGIGALYFGIQGASKADELTQACATGCSSAIALSLEADGEAANRNALILGVTSGVLVVGGAVLYVLSRRSPERPAMALVPTTDGGAAAVLSGRF